MSESDPQLPTAFVADVLLWKRWQVSLGVIVVATVAWLLLEWTSLPFLTICSDVLLILIILLFLHANYAALRNKQPPTLPELVVSEEMVNNVAASFRVKINNVLHIAHDITIGKDFRIFFKVVVCLWLLSVIGSIFSFFTLAYIGMFAS
ncbi:Reticulon [Sesbania bispinosa]|nr:Reticulon [Sesbania bispinosa]